MQTTIIPTGFHTLDALLGGGLRPGTLTLVGARPGMGKTLFMEQIRGNCITRPAVLTGEGEKPHRWIAAPCKYCKENSGGFSSGWIVRDLPNERGAFAFVDDLTYFGGSLAEKTRALAEAAKDRSIVIVAAIKLPRRLERRKDKRPILSDFGAGLFGRGGAARYADNVIALYRDFYYTQKKVPDGEPNAEAIVLKSARGMTGTVDMFFNGKAKNRREAWSSPPAEGARRRIAIDRVSGMGDRQAGFDMIYECVIEERKAK